MAVKPHFAVSGGPGPGLAVHLAGDGQADGGNDSDGDEVVAAARGDKC